MAKLALLFVGLFVSAILVPAVASADAPVLKVTVVSDETDVTIAPGARVVVGLNVTVEFVDYPCTPGTQVGVDLVPPAAPPDWFGADPHPDGDTYAAPKQTKAAALTIVVSDEAPAGSNAVYRLQPVVHEPAATACGNTSPQIEAPEFSIRVRTPAATTASSPGAGEGEGTPGPGLTSILLLGLGLGWLRRRGK